MLMRVEWRTHDGDNFEMGWGVGQAQQANAMWRELRRRLDVAEVAAFKRDVMVKWFMCDCCHVGQACECCDLHEQEVRNG